MAILKPTATFEGSSSNSSLFKIVKDGIQLINFRDDKNKNGNYFFILPPYKLDKNGGGVSWKVVDVRIDFGVGDFKERFVQTPDCPVAYFEKRAKLLYPDYARVYEENVNGQTRKKYPTYGRVQKQVIYNVAYVNSLNLGCHVLHLPWYMAAEKIDEWHRTKDVEGNDNPLVNDPENAIPIWIQLNSSSKGGNPWMVRVDASKKYQLPPHVADSDNLYNLDEILYIPDKRQLIEKLKAITPTDIFNKCMSDYINEMNGTVGTVNNVKNSSIHIDNEDDDIPYSVPAKPLSTAVLTPSTPRRVAPQVNAEYLHNPPMEETIEKVKVNVNSNPMAGAVEVAAPRRMSRQEAEKLLKSV